MADDLHIPMPGALAAGRAPVSTSYRPRAVDDGSLRRWVTIAAAGLGGALLVGMVGWAVVGRRPAVIPVIEADSRPLRVKPENPGGMQFSGADEAVMGGTVTGADRMAPVAEVPAPQALRAQMQPAAPAPTAPAPVVAQAAVPAATATVPAVVAGPPAASTASPAVAPGVSPLPDTPARTQPPAKVAAPAASVTQPARPVSAGATQVQLAALDSEAAAKAEWTRLSKRMPDLLGSRSLVVQKAERDGQPVWRVRTGGFADTAEATGFCGKLRAKGASCTVASF